MGIEGTQLETGLRNLFEDALARAEAGPPDPKNFTGTQADKYDDALNAYESNFLRTKVAAYKTERDANPNKDLATSLYARRIDILRENFMNGAKGGYVDPAKVKEQQASIQGSLMRLDIMGAIKALVMSIPFVGDFLGASGKWLMSKFSKNHSLSFSQAQEHIALEKAAQGALINIGLSVTPEGAQQFVQSQYTTITDRNFTPTPRKTQAPVQVAIVPVESVQPAAQPAGTPTVPADQPAATPTQDAESALPCEVRFDNRFNRCNGALVESQSLPRGSRSNSEQPSIQIS